MLIIYSINLVFKSDRLLRFLNLVFNLSLFATEGIWYLIENISLSQIAKGIIYAPKRADEESNERKRVSIKQYIFVAKQIGKVVPDSNNQ